MGTQFWVPTLEVQAHFQDLLTALTHFFSAHLRVGAQFPVPTCSWCLFLHCPPQIGHSFLSTHSQGTLYFQCPPHRGHSIFSSHCRLAVHFSKPAGTSGWTLIFLYQLTVSSYFSAPTCNKHSVFSAFLQSHCPCFSVHPFFSAHHTRGTHFLLPTLDWVLNF